MYGFCTVASISDPALRKLDAGRLSCSTWWLLMVPHHHILGNFPQLKTIGGFQLVELARR